MNFEFDDNIPIYIQLVEQLKKYIISGRLKAGERLPSVRELALQIQVNPNTMQKALIELEEIGLIYTERTNGKYVTNDNKVIENIKNNYAINLSSKYFSYMKELGFTKEDITKYLNNIKEE